MSAALKILWQPESFRIYLKPDLRHGVFQTALLFPHLYQHECTHAFIHTDTHKTHTGSAYGLLWIPQKSLSSLFLFWSLFWACFPYALGYPNISYFKKTVSRALSHPLCGRRSIMCLTSMPALNQHGFVDFCPSPLYAPLRTAVEITVHLPSGFFFSF